MSKNLGQKLIIISGSPCVGKTTVADSLLNLYGNSAHLDDDSMMQYRNNVYKVKTALSLERQDGYLKMAMFYSLLLNCNGGACEKLYSDKWLYGSR